MNLNKKYINLVNEVKQNIKEITIKDTKKLLDGKNNFCLIDIREESEWKEKRIPSAIYIGKGILEREIEAIVPNVEMKIILYCSGGYRSALSAENLQRMGYSNVFSMEGGIGEWGKKNLSLDY